LGGSKEQYSNGGKRSALVAISIISTIKKTEKWYTNIEQFGLF
jgi:hypothetical protein